MVLNLGKKRAVDHDIFMKLEEVGDIAFVDQPLYYYRRHESGISQGTGNGLLAANFGIMAKMKAYKRRVASGFKPNLTAAEYKKLRFTYNQRYAYTFRDKQSAGQILGHNFKALAYNVSYLFSKEFWSSNIYAIRKLSQ